MFSVSTLVQKRRSNLYFKFHISIYQRKQNGTLSTRIQMVKFSMLVMMTKSKTILNERRLQWRMKGNCGKVIPKRFYHIFAFICVCFVFFVFSFFSFGIAPLIFSSMSKQIDLFEQYQISCYKVNTFTKIIKYLNFFCSFATLIAGLFIAVSYIAFEIVFING